MLQTYDLTYETPTSYGSKKTRANECKVIQCAYQVTVDTTQLITRVLTLTADITVSQVQFREFLASIISVKFYLK